MRAIFFLIYSHPVCGETDKRELIHRRNESVENNFEVVDTQCDPRRFAEYIAIAFGTQMRLNGKSTTRLIWLATQITLAILLFIHLIRYHDFPYF